MLSKYGGFLGWISETYREAAVMDYNPLEDEAEYFKRVAQERYARIAELEERLLVLRQAMPRYGWEDLIADRPEAEEWFDESGSACT